MSSYQYDSVEHGDANASPTEGSAFLEPLDGGRPSGVRKNQRPLVFSLIAFCALVATIMWFRPFSQGHDQELATSSVSSPLPVTLGITATRSCTFEECYEANCNAKVAPFICLRNNGGPHMGCSPVPWVTGTCEDSCNLTDCAKLDIPKDTNTCEGVPCGEDWCKGGQVCPSAAPYQCQVGSARFGCSSDGLQWTLRSDGSTCSKCCDATSC